MLERHGEQAINGDGNNPALAYKWYFRMAWWQDALGNHKNPLRQRVAQVLSELLVISDNSSLELDAVGMGSYYDLLYNNAFGQYADLLYQVSLHPCMGVYLSHMNNRKADPAQHIHPDENYAREILQLFSIGLYQMNRDGSYKLDGRGQRIATYDNRDIKQLARVFTGLKAHSYRYEWTTSFWESSYNGYQIDFEDGIDKRYKTVPFVDMTKPMEVDEQYHDRAAKSLLGGLIKLPAGQGGKAEIRQCVEQLVRHPNTAPFVARHLITQMVCANPSASYVSHVASKFGARGDLKAMIEAVLSYPLSKPPAAKPLPARRKQGNSEIQSQALKSPLLRCTSLLRACKVWNPSKRYWLVGDDILQALQQHPLSSPTVFNFYKPDFTPHGPLQRAALVAPTFELHNSATSIAYVNTLYHWLMGDYYPLVSTQISRRGEIINAPEMDPDTLHQAADKLRPDFSRWQAMAADSSQHDALIDSIGLLLTGRTSQPHRAEIKQAFSRYSDNPLWVVQTVFFLLAISPEFTVQEA